MKCYDYCVHVVMGAVILLLLLSSCDKKDDTVVNDIWRTDIAPIEKRIPLIVPIESCIWQSGAVSNGNSRLVPSPSDYFVLGYARISNEVKTRILENYDWQDAHIDTDNLKRPAANSIVDEFSSSKNFKQSNEFMRDHTKSSTFSAGKIIVNFKTNVMYFDLSSQ